MKWLFAGLSLLFSIPQVLFAYLWTEEGVSLRFLEIFQATYSDIPQWSQLAFSIGQWWYAAPVIFLLLSVVVLAKKMSYIVLLLGMTSSFTTTLAMFYAMYPLHLMAEAASSL